jgi:hypothetical protein
MPITTKPLTLLDPKLIEKQNKAFHRMSKKNQRIAIAKDVLAQLRLKKYRATPGDYFSSTEVYDAIDEFEVNHDFEVHADLQEVLLEKSPVCNVCALGSAAVSLCRLGDEADIHDVSSPHALLHEIFGDQIHLMESAFEGDTVDGGWDELPKEAIRFYERYPDDTKRLAAIFRNIIRNEGTFKP